MAFNTSPGGGKGSAAPTPEPPYPIAPTADGTTANTIRMPLLPIACWMMDDFRFEFNSSIIRPHAAKEFGELKAEIEKLTENGKKPPLSLFGHADPVGDDVYNKKLSGRRVASVHALLTRNPDGWEKLHADKWGTSDDWADKGRAVQVMLAALGFPATKADGTLDPEGVKKYQNSKSQPETGTNDAALRKLVFADYMKLLAGDFEMKKEEFLGQGKDPDGKGDIQGCGEFNPVLMFSLAEKNRLDQAANHEERNAKNSANRRVVGYLFRPGSEIDTAKWPCPKAKDGPAECQKRFWKDQAARRQNTATEREFKNTKDTFACRFYDRMASELPCEDNPASQHLKIVFQKFPGLGGSNADRGIVAEFTVKVGDSELYTTNTEADGTAVVRFPTGATEATVEIFGMQFTVKPLEKLETIAAKDFAATVDGGSDSDLKAVKQRLSVLGYEVGTVDDKMDKKTDQAILEFQANNKLDTYGVVTQKVRDKLKEQTGG